MNRQMQQLFGNNPNFWFGVVEDRADPLQLGRCRVRVHGYHTFDKSEIPTDNLPWSSILMSGTNASLDGVGDSPTGMMIGSFVLGMWLDGSDCQIPFIFGTINQVQLNPSFCVHEKGSNISGFNDNNIRNVSDGETRYYPDDDGSLPDGIKYNNPFLLVDSKFSGRVIGDNSIDRFFSPEKGLYSGFNSFVENNQNSPISKFLDDYFGEALVGELKRDFELSVKFLKRIIKIKNNIQPYSDLQIEETVNSLFGDVKKFTSSFDGVNILGGSGNTIEDSFFGLPGNFFSSSLSGSMKKAMGEIGRKPLKFGQNNPKILEYIESGGGLTDDHISWGKAFVKWSGGGSGFSRSSLSIGSTVIGRISPTNDKKVYGLFMGMRGGMVQLLGANKYDSVGLFSISPNSIKGIEK